MTKLWKSVSVLWAVGMALGVSSLALGATGTGPYYATPSWDQQLPASTRFVVLSNWGTGNEAVLDRETGLVWEKVPRANNNDVDWHIASTLCAASVTGGRGGWHLPTIQELMSLVDPSQSNPALPSGNPFTTVQSSFYLSATSVDGSTTSARGVNLFLGTLGQVPKNYTVGVFHWCVRGGSGVDPQ